ncbi:hypothetical protein [Mangrovibacterium diazotrophicum]|uniref:Uncharacterized protein n=1 Tax=Mangrovibacterium diazotrophicum TaxID=1261403 RepID=A0A419W3K3_9BACT|nr:hypothetical protein [Mangrovibacterium diazotrophicum]RKD90056.1 hypothetical protein BC643_0392 [Mangrovibacterium diazotrophicum]
MKPLEYILFTEEDIRINCIDDYGFSEQQTDTILTVIKDYINKFSAIRSSKRKTESLVIVFEKTYSCTTVSGLYGASDYELILHWLLKALWSCDDRSYFFSMKYLGQLFNITHKKSNNYEIEKKDIDTDELNKLLKSEESGISAETFGISASPVSENKINTPSSISKGHQKNTSIKQIVFPDDEFNSRIYDELKGFFPNHHKELQSALNGNILASPILFPSNQNKFVELFKRAKYNGFLIGNFTEINKWLCSNFTYLYKKGDKKEIRPFNKSSVHDCLTKSKGEPPKDERLCSWLRHKGNYSRY